jgi:hypothetical protein
VDAEPLGHAQGTRFGFRRGIYCNYLYTYISNILSYRVPNFRAGEIRPQIMIPMLSVAKHTVVEMVFKSNHVSAESQISTDKIY